MANPLASRSRRLRRRESFICDFDSASPVIASASLESNFIFDGERSGVTAFLFAYFTSTVSRAAPASARAQQIIASASFPSLESVEVTSTKRLRVLVPTFVFWPLIIGGKERTAPFES